MTTFQLALAGPVPGALAERIRDRFGEVTVRPRTGRTVLEGRIADQAAVRALLDLVWDMGCEIRTLQIAAGSVPAGNA